MLVKKKENKKQHPKEGKQVRQANMGYGDLLVFTYGHHFRNHCIVYHM